mgnify:CR=1 FL=1
MSSCAGFLLSSACASRMDPTADDCPADARWALALASSARTSGSAERLSPTEAPCTHSK